MLVRTLEGLGLSGSWEKRFFGRRSASEQFVLAVRFLHFWKSKLWKSISVLKLVRIVAQPPLVVSCSIRIRGSQSGCGDVENDGNGGVLGSSPSPTTGQGPRRTAVDIVCLELMNCLRRSDARNDDRELLVSCGQPFGFLNRADVWTVNVGTAKAVNWGLSSMKASQEEVTVLK